MSIHAIVRSIVVVLVICCVPGFVQAGEYDVVLGEDESFLLLSRDDRNDAVRAALLRNPGLVEAFGAEAGAHLRWVAPAGTNGIEDLDANQIRVLSSGATYWLGDLGLIAYFDQVAAYLDANPALKDIVINTPDLSYADVAAVPGFSQSWYIQGPGQGLFQALNTDCGPCTPGGVEGASVYCAPNQCVNGCTPPGLNCGSSLSGGQAFLSALFTR